MTDRWLISDDTVLRKRAAEVDIGFLDAPLLEETPHGCLLHWHGYILGRELRPTRVEEHAGPDVLEEARGLVVERLQRAPVFCWEFEDSTH